jgi:hypothetical protein
LFSFVLMPNHFHLFLRTPQPSLSGFSQPWPRTTGSIPRRFAGVAAGRSAVTLLPGCPAN